MNPEDIFKIISSNFDQPLIFKKFLRWRLLEWQLEDWHKIFEHEKLQFRKIPFIKTKEPFWEYKCPTVSLTFNKFIKFQNLTTPDKNYGLYFDYKYMKDVCHNFPEVMKEVRWADLGYPDKSGNESTIWIGSSGAYTLCHQDTYGYNLIAQIYGRKEWILFPPTTNLCPTRVPFEESTIFSKLNLFYPDPDSFKNTEARRIVLEPGDVLYLPHGWWHYVENLDTAISINTWIPLEIDHKKRIEEGLITVFINRLTKNVSIQKYCNGSSELFDDVAKLFPSLEKSVIHCNEVKCNEDVDLKNVEDIIRSNEVVNVVDTMSDHDFSSYLEEKKKRYNFFERNTRGRSGDKVILENIINSFCNPDNISKIADDFIKRSTL